MTPNRTFQAVSEMESHVRRAADWGEVLCAMGRDGEDVAAPALRVVGEAVRELAADLAARWEAAARAAGGRP